MLAVAAALAQHQQGGQAAGGHDSQAAQQGDGHLIAGLRDDARYRGGRGGKPRYGERKPYPKRELPAEGTPESSGTSFKREGGSSTGYRKGGFSGFFGTYLGKDTEDDRDN